ncbi:hypothetical protein HC891_03190 [Candidatus Gracilibacteria bacterium]|nr:hypothetical protein [Candidatus Gracilibacteria bacterium]
MHRTGLHARHRRAHRARRVVRPSPTPAIVPDDERLSLEEIDGWRAGLRIARQLQRQAPAVFAAHVAAAQATPARLIAVLHILLAQQMQQMALDLDYCPLDVQIDDDPAEVIDIYVDHGGALDELANHLWHWADRPAPQVYGCDLDLAWRIFDRTPSSDYLAVVIVHLLQHTSWQLRLPQRIPETITRLRPLATETRVGMLCDALDWSCELPEVSGVWRLGDVIRYVCGQTGNTYADLAPGTFDPDMFWEFEGIWENPVQLAYEVQRQQGAQRLAAVYQALDRRCTHEPALLPQIARAIHYAAQVAATAATPGATLLDIFAEDAVLMDDSAEVSLGCAAAPRDGCGRSGMRRSCHGQRRSVRRPMPMGWPVSGGSVPTFQLFYAQEFGLPLAHSTRAA